MNQPQKLISPILQLNLSLWEELSNTQQENLKGGRFDAFAKTIQKLEPSQYAIDKSTPLIAQALCEN
jgi:hypothetical protein